MYQHFYGLKESPFALTPDPKYLFLTESHKYALASMIYGVHERKGFVLVLGEAGTGKTTLIRHVLRQSSEDLKTAFVFQAVLSFDQLLHIVIRDLEVPCPSVQRLDMIEALNAYLLDEAAAGRSVVVIIDEAQHLSPAVLEDIRLLSNLETMRNKLLQILLVGQPELGTMLGRPELRQLRQRIGVVSQLRPLTWAETCRYIEHRLGVAGYVGDRLFTRQALRNIYRASQGLPRLVNVICDKALLLGYGGDVKRLGRRIVKEALKDWRVFDTANAVASPPAVS
jgi:general secretion pathway protein A